MKSLLLALALFASSLASRAVDYAYFTGAWYDTIAPSPSQRQAGEMALYLWDENAFTVNFFYDGDQVATAAGSYYSRRILGKTYYYFVFTDSNGWRYRGRTKEGSNFMSGTFANGNRLVRGNWQMNYKFVADAAEKKPAPQLK